jgi:FGGY-family pentulose kinase
LLHCIDRIAASAHRSPFANSEALYRMADRRDCAVVAVDVGSSAARAGVFDSSGRLLARSSHAFETCRPAPAHAEHSSEEIWQACCHAVRTSMKESRVDPTLVRGLAFDATCSLALFNERGQPASVSETGEDRWNVVMWADHRAIAEAEEISATRHRVLDFVGGTMSPEMQMPKLLWLKRRDPERWLSYRHAMDLTDFLTWRATGRQAVSTCTVTCKWGYLAHETPGWQADYLALIGLEDLPARASLPAKALPIATDAGRLSETSASELGLSRDCHVGVGLIDAHAGGIGVLGASDPSSFHRRIAMIAGTSTCHMAVSKDARPIPGIWGPYFGAMIPGFWLNEAGQSATGSLLDHVLDWHAAAGPGHDRHGIVNARVAELLEQHGPGFVGNLQVLPDFHGNRSPLADPKACGVIHGLTLDASFDSLARLYYATAVGIALGTRHILDALNDGGYAISHLHLTGGHASSPLLVQLYADATGCRVVLPEEADGVLLGTACVAAAATGLHRGLRETCQALVRSGREIAPDPRVAPFFERRYESFLLLHEHRRAIDRVSDSDSPSAWQGVALPALDANAA